MSERENENACSGGLELLYLQRGHLPFGRLVDSLRLATMATRAAGRAARRRITGDAPHTRRPRSSSAPPQSVALALVVTDPVDDVLLREYRGVVGVPGPAASHGQVKDEVERSLNEVRLGQREGEVA